MDKEMVKICRDENVNIRFANVLLVPEILNNQGDW